MTINKTLFFYSSKNSPIFKNSKIDFVITSNKNGFSRGDFSSLNLGYHVSDCRKTVEQNREKIKNLFYAKKPMIWLNQIHSNIVKIYSNKASQAFCQTGDAIICKNKKVKAMIMVADCIPVCIFDPKHQVFALVHAGREGLFKNIIPKTLEKMAETYNSNAKDLLVFIGPCIQRYCYEVGEEIFHQIQMFFPKHFMHFTEQKNDSFYLDLPKLLKIQLLQYGIYTNNIDTLNICTKENLRLFSYRRNSRTGRFALIATLK